MFIQFTLSKGNNYLSQSVSGWICEFYKMTTLPIHVYAVIHCISKREAEVQNYMSFVCELLSWLPALPGCGDS